MLRMEVISVMKDTFNDKTYSEAVDMAHLRFAVIAPVLQGLFSEPSKTAYYKKVAEKPLVLPGGKEMFFLTTTPLKSGNTSTRKTGWTGLCPPAPALTPALRECFRIRPLLRFTA